VTELKWWHGPPGNSAAVAILLHGFGANEQDLAALASELDPTHDYTWHFPRAPVQLFPGAFGWFPSSTEQIEKALAGDLFNVLAQYDDPSIWQACTALLADMRVLGLIDQLQILGGFSQGSMIAWLTALQLIRSTPKLLLFSTSLVAQVKSAQLLEAKTGPKNLVFMSHGLLDPILPIANATALRTAAERAGYLVTFTSFAGGHEIPRSVILAAQNLMKI
jgi:phospholipase/carboxylesterase